MSKSRSISKIQQLEMQLEEALQMLRLVAENKRTCLEVEQWLTIAYPDDENDKTTIAALLGQNKGNL